MNAIDHKCHTALQIAVGLGDDLLDVTCLLLHSTANIESSGGANMCTPLHIATTVGAVKIVRALLHAHADVVRRRGDGLDALTIAKHSAGLVVAGDKVSHQTEHVRVHMHQREWRRNISKQIALLLQTHVDHIRPTTELVPYAPCATDDPILTN